MVNYSLLLVLGQYVRIKHVKRRDDSSQGAVGVLTAGPTRRAHAQFNLFRGQSESRSNRYRPVVIDVRAARQDLETFWKTHHGQLGRRRDELAPLIKEFQTFVDETLSDHDRPLVGS